MPEFNHPVFGSVGRAERPEVSVQRQQAPAAQAAQAVQPEPPEEPTMASSDLQSLVECGKVTDSIVIDGKRFQMSTLDDDSQEAIIRKFSATENAGNFVELRRSVVAAAVETFNGRPFESVYPADAEPQPSVAATKLALVRMMQGQVVDKLYAFYEELVKRSKQRVDPEQVKN